MSTGNEGGAEQDTETYDSVVEDLNFDPEIPDVQPHPDHPGPGAHASADGASADGASDDGASDDGAADDGEDRPPDDHEGEHG